MEGFNRIDHTLDLFLGHPGSLQPGAMFCQAHLLFFKARRSVLIFSFVADHEGPPCLILMMPRGVPSRRDWRNADGNSSSFPHLSKMPEPTPRSGTWG